MQGAQILRNEAYLQYAAVTKDEAQRSPSALLRAVNMSNGPSALLRAMSLSNGRWTFYEAVILSEANFRIFVKIFWAAQISFFRNLMLVR
jgi:hypothetical protein